MLGKAFFWCERRLTDVDVWVLGVKPRTSFVGYLYDIDAVHGGYFGQLVEPRRTMAATLPPMLAHIFERVRSVQEAGAVVYANVQVRIAFVVSHEDRIWSGAHIQSADFVRIN